jgi:hypothetical protein
LTIEFEYTRDADYLRRLVRERNPGLAWTLGFFVAALLGVAVLCFLTGDGRAVVAGLLSCCLAVLMLQQNLDARRRAVRDFPAYLLEPTHCVITAEAVATTSTSVATRRAWTTFTKAHETAIAYLLLNSLGQHFDVPRAVLTAEQEGELRRLLIDRQLLRRSNSASQTRPVNGS